MMLLPTSAFASIEGRHDSLRWISNDTVGLHFIFYVTQGDDMYILKGLKCHIEIADSDSKEIVVNKDETIYFSDMNADPLLVVPSQHAAFEINYRADNLKKCKDVSATITNLTPIAEYVPDHKRIGIMRRIYRT